MSTNPEYYKRNIEVIDFIEEYELGFHLGNVVKYVSRAGHKSEQGMSQEDKTIDDLMKAKWYLTREIERRMKHAVDSYCPDEKSE